MTRLSNFRTSLRQTEDTWNIIKTTPDPIDIYQKQTRSSQSTISLRAQTDVAVPKFDTCKRENIQRTQEKRQHLIISSAYFLFHQENNHPKHERNNKNPRRAPRRSRTRLLHQQPTPKSTKNPSHPRKRIHNPPRLSKPPRRPRNIRRNHRTPRKPNSAVH